MKQLKFMLAAATAIGLATAAQAETAMKEVKLIDNENFDAVAADTAATTLSGYSYDGATAADNESVVKAGGYGDAGNALQVNTGTDPLLRALDWSASSESANSVTLTADKSVYIDTMVQFTVTPYGDEVEKGDDDKLMIYLKECLGSVNDDGSTNFVNKLMVKAAQYTKTGQRPPYTETFTETDVEISNAEVVAGTWYNLRVTSYVENGITLFTIKLGDTELVSSVALYTDDAKKIFPALTGNSDVTLTYVGFAGEGLVDNLTVATLEPQTSVDFTFKWTTAGISAVTYTIDDGAVVKDQPVTSDTAIADLEPGATITIAVTPADWYALVDNPVLSYEVPATAGQSANLDALVKEVTSADLDVTVPDGTAAATVDAALAWAKAANKSTTDVESAANLIANYLLNVENLADVPQIKITDIDLSGAAPTVTAEVTTSAGTTIKTLTADNINAAAAIKYKAAATLEALKSATSKAAIEAGDQFIQVVVDVK